MKTTAPLLGLVIAALAPVSAAPSEEVYPTRDGRKPSPGNTIYSDPVTDDASSVVIIDCAEVEVGGNVYLPLSEWEK